MKKYILELNEDELDNMIGLIDGCLGTSENESFNKCFKPIVKRLIKMQSGRNVNKSIPKI